MTDETKRPDEQLESLPEKQAEEQVSADDAEAVKGGIIVQGGITAYKISTTLSSPTISPTLDPNLTLEKF